MFSTENYSNDYISIRTRTRACCTPSCRYTRCKRCSCWSGSRDEVVLTLPTWRSPRGVTCINLILNRTDLYYLSLQFKTSVKSTLDSHFWHLKLINHEPGIIPGRHKRKTIEMASIWRCGSTPSTLARCRESWARCKTNGNEFVLTRTGKWEKKESRFKLCLVNKKDTN